MTGSKLNYISLNTLDGLYNSILKNIDLYRKGDFNDFIEAGNWNIASSVEIDLSPLSDLDASAGSDFEVSNSLLVWKSLHRMTPALACENRVWTRLSHVECLEYTRKRWLRDENDVKTVNNIQKHFFARGLTGCRDDHSIARLWWNGWIAKKLRPHDQKGVLKLILKSADIRSNFVERSWTASRFKIADAILRIMECEEWITEREQNFRKFMKALNHRGGGIVFELLSEAEVDNLTQECYQSALVS